MSVVDTGPGVALLGYGAIADMHAVALRAAGARLVVVAGPNRDEAGAFAARHRIEGVETDARAAIETDGVEAVVVASPSAVHAEQARLALEAGRAALVEIPLALSLADAESLAALADERGLVVGVCHTLRFWEPIRVVRTAIAEGRIRPRHVVARALSLRRENVGWTGRRRSWTDDLLWHHGGHVIDLALSLLGSPVADVTASVGPVWEGSGLPMDYAITVRTEDGGVASIALSYNARIGVSDYLVIGEEETIAIAGAEVRASTGVLYRDDATKVQERAIAAQDAAFLAAIRGGPAYPAAVRDVLPTLRVQQAVQDSRG